MPQAKSSIENCAPSHDVGVIAIQLFPRQDMMLNQTLMATSKKYAHP